MRYVVVAIFNGHLALRVGTKVSHHLAFTTDFAQHVHNVVCQRKGQRHVSVGLVISVAKHHALVACALSHRVLAVNATIDVGTLFMNGTENATTFGFKLIFGLGVTDACDGATYNVL